MSWVIIRNLHNEFKINRVGYIKSYTFFSQGRTQGRVWGLKSPPPEIFLKYLQRGKIKGQNVQIYKISIVFINCYTKISYSVGGLRPLEPPFLNFECSVWFIPISTLYCCLKPYKFYCYYINQHSFMKFYNFS